jgi:hypothetical protein
MSDKPQHHIVGYSSISIFFYIFSTYIYTYSFPLYVHFAWIKQLFFLAAVFPGVAVFPEQSRPRGERQPGRHGIQYMWSRCQRPHCQLAYSVSDNGGFTGKTKIVH